MSNYRLELVHIPKCAGSTLGNLIYSDYPKARHQTLRTMVSRNKNKNIHNDQIGYVACFREPISRFISSYRYHTSENYTGIYFKTIPNLRNMSPSEYLEALESTIALQPQSWFVNGYEDLGVSIYGLRFEFIEEDLINLFDFLTRAYSAPFTASLKNGLPQKNITDNANIPAVSAELKSKLFKIYEEDFELMKISF